MRSDDHLFHILISPPPQVAQQAESLATAHRESTEAHARSLAQALQQLKQEVHAEHAREVEARRSGWTQDLAHALVREYDPMLWCVNMMKRNTHSTSTNASALLEKTFVTMKSFAALFCSGWVFYLFQHSNLLRVS